ncbi:MAG TPA: hypothetical protein VK616_12960 [Flavitalea sp.]|nr:hypothetical protein [Flavitalea sp.]
MNGINVSEPGYTLLHDVGTGDINGDARFDIVGAYGWWELPATLNCLNINFIPDLVPESPVNSKHLLNKTLRRKQT